MGVCVNSFLSISIEDRAKANSLKLHKGCLSNYPGCVTQKLLPKRAWEIRSLRIAEQRVSSSSFMKAFPSSERSGISLY